MKNLKKIIVTGLLALSVATTAFATSAYNNPAEIVAGLTGRSELRKDQLAARVADGRLTQEQADKILASIEERQALCDGEGYGYGCGYGRGYRDGNGDGYRDGGRHHHNRCGDCRW